MMFGFKSKQKTPAAATKTSEPALPDKQGGVKKGVFASLSERLAKTRHSISAGLADLFIGKKEMDGDILEDIETRLLMADVGVEATQQIIDNITAESERKTLADGDALLQILSRSMNDILAASDQALNVATEKGPFVILMVGINGVGKTTTIGKLTQRFQSQGLSVMLAAGDTFRAAAVEQLQAWGDRHAVTVVAQGTGADPASVVYDAMESAKAKNIDVLIADTAGRLHTQDNLMEELKKIKRVLGKLNPDAPHETMLVLDASIGQNALTQAVSFHQDIGITGITLTKLDGTAKGGILFSIAKKLGLPIRFIGVGEAAEDLRPFVASEFVAALLEDKSR
ncbi:MAG: signal recognition particle-docking protein FtsY [Gammaproteobacteria bacterium]|nr:signal recognition particle-docking protein FtsY [Gammaproteobacteria bacterium]